MKVRPRVLRKMGYLSDQQGIMNRYLRERKNWEEHLEHTRNFISSAFNSTFPEGENNESVAILGSGWLLDVPLENLVQRFGKIYLVDICHPPQIRKKVELMDQVVLVEEDLSGGLIEQVWQFTAKKGPGSAGGLIESLRPLQALADINPSAFISVNLLNQLDIIICDHLIKQGYKEINFLNQMRRLIQSFHLRWLTEKPGCIITDTHEIITGSKGNQSTIELLYAELPEGFRREDWSWNFDTSGSYRSGARSRMIVQALEWL